MLVKQRVCVIAGAGFTRAGSLYDAAHGLDKRVTIINVNNTSWAVSSARDHWGLSKVQFEESGAETRNRVAACLRFVMPSKVVTS